MNEQNIQNPVQQGIDTGNGLPDEPITQEQIKANRVALMRDQQAETNQAFDPQTGMPLAPANEPPQDPLQEILQQQTPPVVTNTPPIPAAVPPVPQPPAQPPVQPIAPQSGAQPPVPEVPVPPVSNPVQQQLQGEEPQSDLLPEEQEVVDRLNTLMSETQPGTQEQPPVDPTLAALLQQNQILMAQNQQLQAAQQQPPAFAPQPPQADPFGANPAFQWGDPNQQGLQAPPLAPAPPIQPQGVDPNQALLGSAVHQLSQQVTQIQQNNTAFQASQIRDQEIQSLMQTNGISRQHAERAIEYNENGNLQAAAEVINLASAPVIARQMQTHEREVRRDAAGQSLTPAPQGGVRTTPDEVQAKLVEWNAIQSMPSATVSQADTKRLAIVSYISSNPEIIAMTEQTPASIAPPVV